ASSAPMIGVSSTSGAASEPFAASWSSPNVAFAEIEQPECATTPTTPATKASAVTKSLARILHPASPSAGASYASGTAELPTSGRGGVIDVSHTRKVCGLDFEILPFGRTVVSEIQNTTAPVCTEAVCFQRLELSMEIRNHRGRGPRDRRPPPPSPPWDV